MSQFEKMKERYDLLKETVPEGTEIWKDHLHYVSHANMPARSRYEIELKSDWARALTDWDLISLCDDGPYHFGGKVMRGIDRAVVDVYTD